jgi:hypothetical protein
MEHEGVGSLFSGENVTDMIVAITAGKKTPDPFRAMHLRAGRNAIQSWGSGQHAHSERAIVP